MKTTPVSLLVFALILTGVFSAIAAADGYYVITANAGPGGSIVPSDEVLVILNGTQIFSIIPNPGYRIDTVLVNGISVGPRSVYTFSDVYYDQSITAQFSPLTGSISIESDPWGAMVFIDGDYIGRTKAKGALVIDNVAVGTRTVELRDEWYTPWSSQVLVRQGETTIIPLVVMVPVTNPTTAPTTTVPTPLPTTVPTTPPTTIPTTIPTTLTPTPTTTTTTKPVTTTPTTTVTTTPTTAATTVTITTLPTTAVTTLVTTTPTPTATTIPVTTNTPATTSTTIPLTTGTATITTVPTSTSTTATTQVTVTLTGTTTTPATTGTIFPTVSITTSETSASVTPGITSADTTPPFNSNTTGGTPFPAIPGGLNPLMVLLLTGGLCIVPLMADLVIRPRSPVTLPGRTRELISLSYGLIIAGLTGAVFLVYRTGILRETIPPFIAIILPVSAYLVISGLALFTGTLLSQPLRWTASGHLLFSLIGVFVAALALINTPADLRIPLILIISCALAGCAIARWESRFFSSISPPESSGLSPSPETIISPRSPTIPATFPEELLEKYSEPQLIGMGGVARVFKAYNNQTGEVVALKIPVHFNETAGKCFMKEIKAWEDLSHENIVKIHEVNILPVPYVEMEFIGTSLADIAKPLPSGDAARIVRDIAQGLGYAHSRGIIHRDIKPQNILMSDEGIPRITDWGMSKVMGTGFLPTITGFSLSYAAPEQIAPDRFGETDQRTDIYQLGVVFYELLTGELPFGGDDITRVSARILNEIPHLPSDMTPAAVPYDRIVSKCLEKDPAVRYQSVKELVDELERILVTQIDIERYEIFDE